MQRMDEHVSEAMGLVRAAESDLSPRVSRFMGTVLGGVHVELSEMLGEQVRAWRFKRQIKIMEKAEGQLAAAGIDPRSVPFRVLAPLLEGASFEDDDEMVDRWASLLANAASDDGTVPASFPNILREMEPMHARILDRIYEQMMVLAPHMRDRFGVSRLVMAEELDMEEERVRFYLDNLVRQRLIVGNAYDSADDLETVWLTRFGYTFVRACRPIGHPDPEITYSDADEFSRMLRTAWTERAPETQE